MNLLVSYSNLKGSLAAGLIIGVNVQQEDMALKESLCMRFLFICVLANTSHNICFEYGCYCDVHVHNLK